jgi:hypothetical protein
MTPTLRTVAVPDHLERWAALGFEIIAGAVLLPGVRVVLGAARIAVAIEGVASLPDGLELEPAEQTAPAYSAHPNTAIGVDHIVALTPDFDATAAELDSAGLPLKRVRDAGGFRQGFRRLGGPILELVEASKAPMTEWWGLTITVEDLGALPRDLITEPKPAVQPGRQIATALSPGTPLAFMTPEVEANRG